MNAPSPRTKLHPMLWLAALSVTGFSVIGIGAITGLIPSAGGHHEIQTETRMVAAQASQSEAAQPPAAEAVSGGAPARAEAPPPAGRPVANGEPAADCSACGVVEAVHSIKVSGEGSGVGAVAGGVLGGALGNQVGKGGGRDLATIGGAVLGGIAGHQVEKKVRSATRYEVVVRLDSGKREVLRFSEQPRWHEGDRVAVRDGQLQPLGS